MLDLHASPGLAAFLPGAPFILRLQPRGNRIIAQFGVTALGLPGTGLLDGTAWTAPVDTGLAPRTDRATALEWARTAFPGADVRWGRRHDRIPVSVPLLMGDGMAQSGDGQAGSGLPIVTAAKPTR